MPSAYEIPQFRTSQSAPGTIDAGLIAVPVVQDECDKVDWLESATAGDFAAAVQRGHFTGKVCEVWLGAAAGGGGIPPSRSSRSASDRGRRSRWSACAAPRPAWR